MTTGSFRGRASYFPKPRGVVFSRREENRLGHIVSGTRFGPYEIGALVGTGGMAEVYRAQDTRLDRTVAVKVLASHLSDDAGLRQRFEREAETISSLNHPHICILFDVGRWFIQTIAPALARHLLIEAPIPRDPPVTKLILLVKLTLIIYKTPFSSHTLTI